MAVKEVAEKFNKTRRTIMNWVEKGLLKGHKIGGSWFFLEEDVDALMYGEKK